MVLLNVLIIVASIALAGALYFTSQRNRATWRQCRFPADLDEQKQAYRDACRKFDEMMRKK